VGQPVWRERGPGRQAATCCDAAVRDVAERRSRGWRAQGLEAWRAMLGGRVETRRKALGRAGRTHGPMGSGRRAWPAARAGTRAGTWVGMRRGGKGRRRARRWRPSWSSRYQAGVAGGISRAMACPKPWHAIGYFGTAMGVPTRPMACSQSRVGTRLVHAMARDSRRWVWNAFGHAIGAERETGRLWGGGGQREMPM
jgi:hypothetical protein